MRLPLALLSVATILISACSGSGSFSPPPSSTATSQSGFGLAPSTIDLSPGTLVDNFNGQGDTAGVTYTPTASSACSTSSGSIVVGGDSSGQLDVAGSPLIFTVAATGATPPATCTVTVTGSDGSSASVTVNYNNPPVTDVPDTRARVNVAAGATPTALSFTALVTQTITVSGFIGTVTPTVACKSAKSGLTVAPSDASTFAVIPWGQGSIANTCTIALTDTAKNSATVNVAMSIGAMGKLTASPRNVQFGCAGSSTPYNCETLTQVAIAENGNQTYNLWTRPGLKGTCAKAFYGPLQMTADGKTFSQSIAGSAVTVTFAGLLTTTATSLDCSQIVVTDSNSPAQRVAIGVTPAIGSASSIATANAPPCTGPDARVAAPNAPHGMYVWNPYQVDGGEWESSLEQYVIGKDPDLCGVSLLVEWSEVEKTKGGFDWSKVITQAGPYFNAGLTVNLLFVDSSESGNGTDSATPAWVFNQDGVAKVTCPNNPAAPDFMDPTFEADWEAFIDAAVAEFSLPASQGGSSITAQVGYMRFGIGAGTEAYAGHMTGNSASAQNCLAIWSATPSPGWTYDKWVTHTRHIVNHMGSLNTHGKQLMVAMNEIPNYPNTIYDYPNAEAEVAANNGVGFGTENLGIGHVADNESTPPPAPTPPASPMPCSPQANNGSIYWCQAFYRHVGVVPFEFQPIEAVALPLTNADGSLQYNINFANMLQYGLVNNAQIFELYPQDWLEADGPSGLLPTNYGENQQTWRQALDNTAVILGAHHQ